MIRQPAELPFVSIKTRDEGENCSLRTHSHRELSIGLVLEGSSRVYAEGLDFHLGPGDLILIPAEQVHLCRPSDSGEFYFRMLYIDPDWTARTIGHAAHTLPAGSLSCPPEWQKLLGVLSEDRTWCSANIDSPVQELATRLRELISTLSDRRRMKLHEGLGAPAENDYGSLTRHDGIRDRLERVHERISTGPQYRLTVDEMASLAGMSKYSFLRSYTARYGITPHSSVSDHRVRLSLELIQSGSDLAEIAQECGFSDQSHFIRQFRLYTGLKPSEYRKAILSNPN